ncbi:hypothetical protein Tsubulata_038199, partial [Turnera subulata]
LLAADGREWAVGIVSRGPREGLGFANGWSNFVRDNHLKPGDICIFELIKLEDIKLRISVFHLSLERTPDFEYKPRRKRSLMETKGEIDDVNKTDGNYDEEFSREDEDMEPISGKKFSAALSRASEQSQNAYIEAKKFRTNNPSFIIVLRPYHFSQKKLCVPTKFKNKYVPRTPLDVIVQLPDGRAWHLEMKWRDGLYFQKGWQRFYEDNDLKEGDICIFELIETRFFSLKLTLFPAKST